jgi:hypothetical protein
MLRAKEDFVFNGKDSFDRWSAIFALGEWLSKDFFSGYSVHLYSTLHFFGCSTPIATWPLGNMFQLLRKSYVQV